LDAQAQVAALPSAPEAAVSDSEDLSALLPDVASSPGTSAAPETVAISTPLVANDQTVLGIRCMQCASCGASAVRNRAFVEERALYCDKCWGWYERCGHWGPSIRVNTNPPTISASGAPEYGPQDCFMLSAFVCPHDDLTLSRQMCSSLPENKEFLDWHGSRHLALHLGDDDACQARNPETSTMPLAWQESVARLETAFGMRAMAIRMNLYRDSSDWKPLHHDRGQDNEGVPQLSVGVSLGATRELVFMHKQTGVTMSFPLRNGDVFAFTPELNMAFMHGVAKTKVVPEDDGPRLSFVIWGPRVNSEGNPIAKPIRWGSRRSEEASSEAVPAGGG